MMAIVGWIIFCGISGVFGFCALFMLLVVAQFHKSEGLIMAIIFGLLSSGFGYAAYSNAPFAVVMK